jgi:hypothetical protein
MKNILDLRFIIGSFFLLVGLFLFIGSFIMQPGADKSELVNRWCGLAYIIFSVFMLILWQTGRNKASSSESDE